jgi:tetratricopeptide (TPR) repeat protein
VTQPTIAGVHLEHVTVGGNLTISGVTIQLPPKSPPLWVNLPRLPAYLFGRDTLVDTLVEHLCNGRTPAVALHGLPGVGKSTLAAVLAYHPSILAHFTDGVLWAGLGPQGDAMSALTAWGAALGVDVTDQPTPQQRSQAVRNAVGQKRLLLAIDDAWQLEPAQALACGGPYCTHFLTTRDLTLARGLAGAERTFPVPELDDDPAYTLLQTLAPEACVADPSAAHALASAVGGLPLALELVGGFLAEPEHSLFAELSAEAWDQVSDPARRLKLASVRLGALDGRQVTLQETIALSLEHLPQSAVEAFYALGAFAPKPAAFDLAAAKAVAEASAATLATLVARSLVEQAGPESLALHQTIADVARMGLPPATIERHRDYYLALVDEDREDWERIGLVYAQVMQAWTWQVEREPEDGRLLDIYWSLRIYQTRQGLWRDFADLAEQCLAWAQAYGDQRNEAILLNELGYMHNALGDQQQALAYYEQAFPLFRQVGDKVGEAATLNNIGRVNDDLRSTRQALAYYEQALPLFRQTGDRRGEAATLNNIGRVYDDLDDKQQALVWYEQALLLVRQAGDRGSEARTLNNIGLVYFTLGDQQQGLVYYEQALPLVRQAGDRRGEATTLSNIGRMYSTLGDQWQALAYYEQGLPLLRQVGDRRGEATTLTNIGAVYDALGDKQQALAYYAQALPLLRQVGDRAGEATTLNNMAFIYFQQGQSDRTVDMLRQAIDLERAVGAVAKEAGHSYNLAYTLHHALDQTAEAIQLLHHSVALLQRYNLPQDANGATLAQHQALLQQLQATLPSGSDRPKRSWRNLFGRKPPS